SVTEYTTLEFWVDSVGVYILADSSTGINNSNLIVEKFEIAPNPASNNINLLLNTTTNLSTTISILNTLGEKIYQIQTNLNTGANNVSLNINNLANGVYFIQLNDGVHQQTKKLIKQTR
ncbi:MAG TPA: T9SS type A sorting domain-containing protein, partial [Vicingus sp.]|nr:T9SS type A sorting domain-containing protein [Vicingus sp.]